MQAKSVTPLGLAKATQGTVAGPEALDPSLLRRSTRPRRAQQPPAQTPEQVPSEDREGLVAQPKRKQLTKSEPHVEPGLTSSAVPGICHPAHFKPSFILTTQSGFQMLERSSNLHPKTLISKAETSFSLSGTALELTQPRLASASPPVNTALSQAPGDTSETST